MIWLIGLILFAVELYVLLHTTYCKWVSISYSKYRITSDYSPLTVRVYHVLLLLLGNIWWVSVLTAVIFFIIYLIKTAKPGITDWDNNKGTLWRLDINNWLTKEIQINRDK